MNPLEASGPAWGLLQVTEVVRTDFNARHRTRYSREDLLEARINVTIATDLLRRIISGGVGRVARFLEGQGRHQEISIDTIHAAAREAGASRHLSNPKKVAWCKGVAALYWRERTQEASELLA
jgi:hypothetical protein